MINEVNRYDTIYIGFLEYPTHRVHLQQCRTCGRQFKAESLVRYNSHFFYMIIETMFQ